MTILSQSEIILRGIFTYSIPKKDQTYYLKVVGKSANNEETRKIIDIRIDKVPDATTDNISYATTWNNGKATITVTSSLASKYHIETSKNNTTFTKTKIQDNLESGDKIYVRFASDIYSGKSLEIKAIDNGKPQVNVSVEDITSRSIKIKAVATDNESQFTNSKPFKYYIATDENQLTTLSGTNTTGDYTFDRLDANTTYFIKVTREDAGGNEGSKIVTAVTNQIPQASTAILRTIKWKSDGSASVELSTEEDYTISYSTDNTNWRDYTQELNMQNGESLHIRLTDGINVGRSYEIELSDYQGPEVTLARGTIKTNSITVNVQAEDNISGMPETPKYTYYIKNSKNSDYTMVAQDIEQANYTFTGLTAGNTYNIKVTAKDIVGNVGTGTIDASTPEFTLATGNIEFKNETWSNGKSQVTIKNNTDNNLQYQIINSQTNINDEAWQVTEQKEKTLSELNNGDIIVARLFDGTNWTRYATYNINDGIAPQIQAVAKSTEAWTKENITITVTARDNETGLDTAPYSFDGGTTWQEESSKQYTENTSGIVIKVKDKAGNIANYSHTLNITNIDKTGPEMQVETEVTSSTITAEITNITDGSGSGVNETAGYTYYIATSMNGLESATGEKLNTKTKTFTNLTTNTTYYIKVEAKDKLGNIGTIIKTAVPGALNVGSNSLTITNPVWSNKQASVTINNTATQYDIEYQIVRKGNTFDVQGAWTRTTQNSVNITGLKSGDTVYSRLTDNDENKSGTIQKEIIDNTAPTVTVTGMPTEWTKEDVTLQITSTETESGLQAEAYSFDGGTTWQESNTKTYSANTSGIVIKVRDEAGNIGQNSETIDITLIDKSGPNVQVTVNDKSTKDIQVTVSSGDSGVGMENTPTYTYYIKQSSESEYTKITETTSTNYTYENLRPNVEYTIKVEVADKLGNIGEKAETATTENLVYEIGNIEMTSIVWSNGIATINMINNRTDFPMEYQIAENGEALSQSGTWTKVTSQNIEIGNLKDGYIIYARLTDNVNATESYVTFNINNGVTKTYTESTLASQTTRGEFEIYGISTSDNEIRVQIDGEQSNASLYNYYYKTINDEEYTLISTNTYYYDQAVIKNVEPGTTYKIKAMITDRNGNVTRSENTATMIAGSQAALNQSYTDNKTYIDNSRTITTSKTAGTGTIIPNNTEQISAGYTVSVPGTFKVTNNVTQNRGIVLQDANQNEFVWIPVNDAIYDGVTEMPTSSTNASITYKPMAMKWAQDNSYYESIIYYYNGVNSWKDSTNTGIGKSAYKEPSLVTNNASDGYTWRVTTPVGKIYDAAEANYKTNAGFESAQEMGIYLANSYNAMITSVDAYGGFLVGRYETTGTGESLTTKPNSDVYTGINWYTMLKQLDSVRNSQNPYYNTVSVKSSMIWGSQWDAVLNFLLKGDNENYISTKKLGTSKLELSQSATDEEDMISNIYDLGSNAYEWTIQANSYSYRVARGGGYNVIYADKMSTKKDFNPTDSGPALGTRMALYIQSTSDTTKPSLEFLSKEVTSNSITVNCSAIDRETGIKKYDYYISEDGVNWENTNSGISGTYKFMGLKQNTKYYIKIQATDGAGNTSDEIIEEATTSKLGRVAETNIELIQRLGTNDNGTIALQAKSEYTDLGYYIEYQIADSEEELDANNWTKSDIITGVKTGETIYATLFDGVNRSEDYFIYEVEDLEQFRYIDIDGNTYTEEQAQLPENANKTSRDKTIKYTDAEGAEAYIPAGFKVGVTDLVNNIDNGLVIQDKDDNQFVWVPVPDAIYQTGKTLPVNINQAKTDTLFYRPMAIAQKGYPNNYESIIYSFQDNSGKTFSFRNTSSTGIGKSSYREPSLVTASADYIWNLNNENKIGVAYDVDVAYYQRMGFVAGANVNAFKDYTEFGHYLNNEYTNMIQSVDRYKGFYVGRFETSTETQLTTSNRAQDVNTVVESKRNKTPISNQMWYKQFYYQDSNLNSNNPYYGSDSVTCSMISGCQWDAIMNWFLLDPNTSSFVTVKVGNHEERVAKTGEFVDDLAKNIFDMSSNMIEHTKEAYSTSYRMLRGSAANTSADTYYYNTSNRLATYGYPTYSQTISNVGSGNKSVYYHGSRMSLYIKNQEDTTKPEIENVELEAKTNNIKATVTAKDGESGISKFKYTLLNASGTTLEQVETYRAVNTFYGLAQGESYTINVSVVNTNGIESDVTTKQATTVKLNLTDADITLEKTWGKNGDGRAYFKLADEYENSGYYLQHVVLQDASEYSEDIWTTENIIDKNKIRGVNNTQADKTILMGLSTGDIVFTRIYDGNNSKSAGIQTMVVQITNLEEYKYVDEDGNLYSEEEVGSRTDTSKTQNIVYEDSNGATATIPAGFKVGATSLVNTIANGLVIEDSDENQFVWIPVKDAIYDTKVGGTISSANNFTPMAVLQSADSPYYEGISYTYNVNTKVATRTSTSSYGLGKTYRREPSLVTGTKNFTWSYDSGESYDGKASNYNKILNAIGITNATELGIYMNNEYTAMVQSVDKYKGFYAGRYETTAKDDANKAILNNNSFTNVARTKLNYAPMVGTTNMNWYRMFLLQDSNYEYNPYHENASVRATMIWGSQWDQIMNFILKGQDKDVITTITGNHTGAKAVSGQFGNDIANNIFELSSNMYDWTLEAYSTNARSSRGGYYPTTSTAYAVSLTSAPASTSTSSAYGSRMALYLK